MAASFDLTPLLKLRNPFDGTEINIRAAGG
jgi:hypothetical protein